MPTRRTFLQMALAPAAVSMLGCKPVMGAPAIIKPELTPQQFGATGGDPVADTQAWNRAMIAASESGRPIMVKGTYVLRAPAASTWNWRNRASAATRVYVQLRSGVQVFGNNAEILIGQPEKVSGPDEPHLVFGTGLNITPGALKDIRFEGINFDFREEFGPVHRPIYAFGITGVDDFQRHNLVIRSSGNRAGRGLLAENVRRRVDRGLKMINLEQGIFTHYEHGLTMDDIEMDGFNEGFDFDGPAWDVNLTRLKFRNAYREAQCIDTAGGARWMVSDVQVKDVGAVIYIYNKSISWPTYEQWLKADDGKGHELVTPNFVLPEKMTIKGVRGSNVGKGLNQGKGTGKEEALHIGNYRARGSHADFPGRVVASPKDITIEDWVLDGCYRFGVNDCENLVMRNITLNDVKTPDDPETGAALVLREAAAALGGSVTGLVSDVRINRCDGMGVSIVAGRGLKLQNVTVKQFNQQDGSYTGAGIRVRHRPGGSADLAQLDRVSASAGQPGDVEIDSAARAPDTVPKDKQKKDKEAKKGGKGENKRAKKPQKVPVDY